MLFDDKKIEFVLLEKLKGVDTKGWIFFAAAAVLAAALIIFLVQRRKKCTEPATFTGNPTPTVILVHGALCIAISFVLSYFKLFSMPNGGSITLASMLPLMVYSNRYGAKYGVMAGGFLVNIPGGKEKARHIFINATGGCEVVPRYAVVGIAGWQSEVRKGRGAWSVRRLGCAFFPCQQFYGFGKALPEKLHDKINGCAAFALAVPVPFVSPDSQAVVPLPAVFISGTGKLLAL